MISDVKTNVVKEGDYEWDNVFYNEFGNIVRVRKWNPYTVLKYDQENEKINSEK